MKKLSVLAVAVVLVVLQVFGVPEGVPGGWLHVVYPLRAAVVRGTKTDFESIVIGGPCTPPAGVLWLMENGVLKGLTARRVVFPFGEKWVAKKDSAEWCARFVELVKSALPEATVSWSDQEKGDVLPKLDFWPPKGDSSCYGFTEVPGWTFPVAKDGVVTVTGSPAEVGWQLREMKNAINRKKAESPELLVMVPDAAYLKDDKGRDTAVDTYLAVRNLMGYAQGLRAKRYLTCTFPVPADASESLKRHLAAVNTALMKCPHSDSYNHATDCTRIPEKIAALRAEGLGPVSTIGRDRFTNKRWKDRFEKNLAIIRTNDTFDVVLVGDSITHRWDSVGRDAWRDVLGKYRQLNAGYIGDLTQHMIWRLNHGELDGYKAKVFMVMAGTNNRWTDPADVAAGVQEVVKLITGKHPESKILLQAVFPRGQTPADTERIRVMATNKILEPWAKTLPNVVWVDLKDHFLSPDGTISKDVFPDFLHPEHDGYYIWAKAVKPYLENLIDGKGAAR